jgi:hypothetical protein
MPVSEPPASSPRIGPQGAKFISSGFSCFAEEILVDPGELRVRTGDLAAGRPSASPL